MCEVHSRDCVATQFNGLSYRTQSGIAGSACADAAPGFGYARSARKEKAKMFKALVLEKTPEFSAAVREVDDSFLPDGDVTIDVAYSTVNYKDALAITNRSPVVRNWPMVAGIDGSGTVVASSSPVWKAGDEVILNGFGVGETHKGCLAERARLKGEWLIRRPPRFGAREAMVFGDAASTAMLCVLALERHGRKPGE